MESADVLLRVESGNPDDTELAALAAVLYALQAAEQEAGEESAASDLRWWHGSDAYSAPASWR
jgi:hypothetical protein